MNSEQYAQSEAKETVSSVATRQNAGAAPARQPNPAAHRAPGTLADTYDVVVLGGGPAGLAAALAAQKSGARVLLVEREARLGGILKQCIHDGFGLVRFGKKLAGPEYAQRFIDEVEAAHIETALLTFCTRLEALAEGGAQLTLVSRSGLCTVRARALVLATGCRERTAKQIAIHGTRPAGVFTAGSAQYYTNVLGQMPARRCVVLGSGDIGLIMARRLTLEGAEVLGVYEAKPTPSGLSRNISQCLTDFGIPLHTSCTVTRVFGRERLEAVELAEVDERMRPIPGTERRVACDTLILSVGLIPENELAERLGAPLDRRTKGPVCDQTGETLTPGVFSCGNALQVNDLVDYVSESGETAGAAAAAYQKGERSLARVAPDDSLLCAVPQRVDNAKPHGRVTLYFRSRVERGRTRLVVAVRDGANGDAPERVAFRKTYRALRPPEMERVEVNFEAVGLSSQDVISLRLEAVPDAEKEGRA